MKGRTVSAVLGLLLLGCAAAAAQPIPVRGISVAAGRVNFSYTGNVEGGLRYDYQGPVVTAVYRQPSLFATTTVGTGSPVLLDVALSGWVPLRMLDVQRRGLRVPVIVSLGHLRVLPGGAERWDATRFGLGLGVQWEPPDTGFTLRVNPLLSMVTSSLATGYGFAAGAEADAALVVAELHPGWHLELGYTFRYQVWNINPPKFVDDEVDRYFDYRSLMHFARAGLLF